MNEIEPRDPGRDQMQIKWMSVGEQLDTEELDYMCAENVEPGFNDHSSRSILEAFRAGREHGHCCGG